VQVDNNSASYGYHSANKGFELRAGSKRHQHIVAFQSSVPGNTRFELVALDLPADSDGSGKTD